MVSSVVFVVVWAFAISTVRGEDVPSPANFIRRHYHAAITLGNYLYVDGGEISEYVDGKPDSQTRSTVNSTLSIPIDQSWTNATVRFQASSKSPSPLFKGTTLWADQTTNTLYTWGGDASLQNRTDTAHNRVGLYGFSSDGKGGGAWTVQQPANPAVFTTLLRSAMGAGTTCAGFGLVNGGYGDEYTDATFVPGNTLPVPGVLTYNISSRMWANESATPFVKNYVYGSASCLPSYGVGGLVVFLGGSATAPSNADTADVVRMDNITFYDPTSKAWYWQMATGEVPVGRTSPCTAIVKSPNATYEIFVYGGDNYVESTSSLDDVYVLTIPGFRWFKGSSGTPRAGHKCVIAGNSQMISVGGVQEGPSIPNIWTVPDPWTQGIGVLDLSTMTWKDGYDAKAAAYDSPKVVKDFYSTNPSITWSNDAAKGIFQTLGSKTTNPSSSASSTTNPPGGGSSTNAGAIAGGVVGGVALLAALLGLVWFLRRRSRRQYEPASSVLTSGAPTSSVPTSSVQSMNQYSYEMPQYQMPQQRWHEPENKPLQMAGGVRHELAPEHGYQELDNEAPRAQKQQQSPAEMQA